MPTTRCGGVSGRVRAAAPCQEYQTMRPISNRRTLFVLTLILASTCATQRARAGGMLLACGFNSDQIHRYDATTGAYLGDFGPGGDRHTVRRILRVKIFHIGGVRARREGKVGGRTRFRESPARRSGGGGHRRLWPSNWSGLHAGAAETRASRGVTYARRPMIQWPVGVTLISAAAFIF